MEVDFLVSLVKRDICLYQDLLKKVQGLKSLDKFLKPSYVTQFGPFHELEELKGFLDRNHYFFDGDTYSKCFSVTQQVGNNLYYNYDNPTKGQIIVFEQELMDFINGKIKRLNDTIEEIQCNHPNG